MHVLLTQNTLEGLHFTCQLGTPLHPPGGADGSGQGQVVWDSLLKLLPQGPGEQNKMKMKRINHLNICSKSASGSKKV